MIKFEAKDWIDPIAKLPEQMKFAGAVALTRMAKLIQTDIKEKQLPDNFNLKNTWTQRGIRITHATKGTLFSEVWSKDWYMPGQDQGEKRQSSKTIWIPGKDFAGVTGIDPHRKVIPKAFRSQNIFKKKFPVQPKTGRGKSNAQPFLVKAKSGAELIMVRSGDSSEKPKVLYVGINKTVNIRGRRFFQEPAQREYDRHFLTLYDEAWSQYVKL